MQTTTQLPRVPQYLPWYRHSVLYLSTIEIKPLLRHLQVAIMRFWVLVLSSIDGISGSSSLGSWVMMIVVEDEGWGFIVYFQQGERVLFTE